MSYKAVSDVTVTFHIRDEYFIDVVFTEGMYELWLYNKGYGIKKLVVGIEALNHSNAIDGMDFEDDIAAYKQDVED